MSSRGVVRTGRLPMNIHRVEPVRMRLENGVRRFDFRNPGWLHKLIFDTSYLNVVEMVIGGTPLVFRSDMQIRREMQSLDGENHDEMWIEMVRRRLVGSLDLASEPRHPLSSDVQMKLLRTNEAADMPDRDDDLRIWGLVDELSADVVSRLVDGLGTTHRPPSI